MHIHKTAVKKKDGKQFHYLRLVQSYRKPNGKVDHKIIANLGRSDLLTAFMPQIQKALGLSTPEEARILVSANHMCGGLYLLLEKFGMI